MKHILKVLEQALKNNYYSYKELERYHREEVKKNNELTEEVKRLKQDLFELSREYTNGRKTKTT